MAAKPAKGGKLASIKKALLGIGAKKGAKSAPAAKAAAPAKGKAAAPALSAKNGKKAASGSVANGKAAPAGAAKAAAPAPAPVTGKRGKAAPTAAQVRGKAAQQALSQIATAKSGGKIAAIDTDICREVACEGLATSGGYCRLHYIKNWKKIQRKSLILKEGKLNQYIEELVTKYPDKYIEAIRQDLASDKDFAKVIYDLDLDESVDEFTEGDGEASAEALIDNIKREFDDEGDAF
jgi:hypothetical protein